VKQEKQKCFKLWLPSRWWTTIIGSSKCNNNDHDRSIRTHSYILQAKYYAAIIKQWYKIEWKKYSQMVFFLDIFVRKRIIIINIILFIFVNSHLILFLCEIYFIWFNIQYKYQKRTRRMKRLFDSPYFFTQNCHKHILYIYIYIYIYIYMYICIYIYIYKTFS